MTPQSSSGDFEFTFDLEGLIQRHCSSYGNNVCETIINIVRRPDGFSSLLNHLGISQSGDEKKQVQALANWLKIYGPEEFLRSAAMLRDHSHVSYKPNPILENREEIKEFDQKLIQSLTREEQRSRSNEQLSGSLDGMPLRQYTPPPTIPFKRHSRRVPTPPEETSPSRSYTSQQESYSSHESQKQEASVAPPVGPPYKGPPDYPHKWPSQLQPGPVVPPEDILPDQLTWPYVERRTTGERRRTADRRNAAELIFKNRRYGGDRRRGDRRKSQATPSTPNRQTTSNRPTTDYF